MNVIAIPFFCSALIAGAVGYFAYRRRGVQGAKTLMWILLALTVWAGSGMMENLNEAAGWHLFWAQMGYFGVVSVPVLWVLFTIQYSEHEKAPRPQALWWLWIVPLFTLGMVWTNSLHSLHWSAVRMTTFQGMHIQDVEHGMYFWIHAIYSYASMLVGTVIVVRKAIQADDSSRAQASIMLTAIFVLFLGNGLYVFDLLPFKGLDITPLTFTLSSAVIAWGLFRFRLLNAPPINTETILQNLEQSLLVTDATLKVVFVNAAFEHLTGVTPAMAYGKKPEQVLLGWPQIFDLHKNKIETEINVRAGSRQMELEVCISPLWRENMYSGCIYAFHPLKEQGNAHREADRMGQETKPSSAIFLVVNHTDGKIQEVNSAFLFNTGYRRAESIGYTPLQLGLWDIETRASITRLLRQNNNIQDYTVYFKTRSGKAEAWMLSISLLSVHGEELQFWAARPVQ